MREARGLRDGRLLAAGLFATLVAACGESTDTTILRLSAYAPAGCEPPRDARLRLTALGDFATTETTSEDLLLSGGSELVVPVETLAFEATAEGSGQRFIGYGERTGGRVDLLLWPEGRVCPLGEPREYPAPGGGQAFGYAPATRTLLIAGGSAPELPSASVGVLSFDSGTGTVTSASGPATSLREPRAFATVTPFGEAMLVAGGENPLHGEGALAVPRKTAEVFLPANGRFAPSIELVEERSQHAALSMADGTVLLVGGRGAASDALRVLELVDPKSGSSSLAGLTALRAPRVAPRALSLDDGRLFVGGGMAADGTPLSALEWLSPDAREHLGVVFAPDMPARHDRAFAALPGGGVLAVGGCEARLPRDDDESAECERTCRRGCPPSEGYDAWWIAPSGELHRLDFELSAPRPVLLGGRDGAPLLAPGESGEQRLYRFDPWRGEFDALDVEVPFPPSASLPAQALDVEAFVWLAESEEGASLQGLRLGTRNRYSRDVFLVAQSDPEFPERPLHLVPDRPLDRTVVYDGTLRFAAQSPVSIYVAATEYADVSLTVDFAGAPPTVLLGATRLGGQACPWPEPTSSPVRVIRDGTSVELVAGDRRNSCAVEGGRLPLALGASDAGEARIASVDVSR